jgi:hypothetical protein
MDDLLTWLKRHLARERNPDLIIAIMAGVLAWVLTCLLRALMG